MVLKINRQSKVENLLRSFKETNEWQVSFVADTSYFPLFKRKQEGTCYFTNSKNKSKKASLTIFNFSIKDVDFLAQMTDRYIMLSSCIYAKSEYEDSNFISFVKDDLFFLLNRCPCNTDNNSACRILAKSINNWVNN